MTTRMYCPGCKRPTKTDDLRCPECREEDAGVTVDPPTEPPEKLTACKDCENYIPEENFDVGGVHVSHDHKCKACPKPSKFDPIQGVSKTRGHVPCKEVNTDGHCQHFKRRED